MVNPGGESTMLDICDIVLTARPELAGRFEEAYALASRPDVTDHHHAVQFRSRLARPGCSSDATWCGRRPGGAIEDLDLGERIRCSP